MRQRIKSEGGSGGKRGHSNMVHRDRTDEVKRQARKARRRYDESEASTQRHEQLGTFPTEGDDATW